MTGAYVDITTGQALLSVLAVFAVVLLHCCFYWREWL